MAENTKTLFADIRMNVPEGFRELTEEEFKAFFKTKNPRQWAVWNKENHAMISSEYKKVLPWILLNICARNTHAHLKKTIPHYQEIALTRQDSGPLPCYILEYTYSIGDTPERAWTVILMNRSLLGTVSFVVRADLAGQMHPLFDASIRSLRLKEQ